MTPRTFPVARAIVWEYLAHHPRLVAALAAGFPGLVALAHAMPGGWVGRGETIPITIGPVAAFLFGIVALFTLAPGRPRSAPGGYPARLFLYPVSTARLVAWPMLAGAASLALGWVGVATLVLPRFGYHPPVALGALAAAAAMAWLQAFAWWPFGTSLGQLFGVALSTLAPGVILVVPMVVWGWGPVVAWALLPIYLVAACALAVRGVALDRRGDGRGGLARLAASGGIERLIASIPGARSAFASAGRAQLWLEWRSKGAVVFTLVLGMTSTILLAAAILPGPAGHDPAGPPGYSGAFAMLFLQPLLICAAMGATFAKDEMGSRTSALSPFAAARPVPTAALAAAKLGAAALTVLASYGAVLAAASLWAAGSGRLGMVAAGLRGLAGGRGAIATAAVAAMATVVALALIWKGMVGMMVPMLTGRAWLLHAFGGAVAAAMVLALAAAIVAAPAIGAAGAQIRLVLAGRAAPPRPLVVGVPIAIGLALGLKLTLAVLAFGAAIRRGLIGRRGLAVSALIWAVPTMCLLGLAALLRPSSVAGWLTLAMLAALLPPLGRLPAATLALDWNRRR